MDPQINSKEWVHKWEPIDGFWYYNKNENDINFGDEHDLMHGDILEDCGHSKVVGGITLHQMRVVSRTRYHDVPGHEWLVWVHHYKRFTWLRGEDPDVIL